MSVHVTWTAAEREKRGGTHLEAICLQALGMAHSMTVKAQAAREEKRQR